ncbi:MAG: hypothetical protein RQ966_18965 [Acetobacteraceae bacterium]|nr:hypothetical protein [Acetobacteraceae bacterium]
MTATGLGSSIGEVRQQGRRSAIGLLSRPAVFGSLVPLVTALNALVGLVLPMLMAPSQFGEYALVVTLFQYGLIFDLGASQLIDRWIPAHLGTNQPDAAERVGQRLLWLRLYIAATAYAVTALVLVALAARQELPFSLGTGLLSALAGILYMAALGPACLYRAHSARRNYAISIAALSFGLVAARLGGMLAGGTLGCFAALALWYLVFAGVVHLRMPPRLAERPSLAEAASLAARGLPLFATSFVWAFYVTANRWFASRLIAPGAFGQFAFGANIFALIVGTAAGFSAFYYPRITARLAGSAPFALSRRLTADCSKLVTGVTAVMVPGILLAGTLIGLVYPAYVHGVATARILLVAAPPVVLASWLMPISLSSGRRPWVDGIIVYPVATALLGAATYGLFQVLGVAGAAWASSASGVPLIAMQLALLHHAGIFRSRHAAALLAVTVAASGALACLVWVVSS